MKRVYKQVILIKIRRVDYLQKIREPKCINPIMTLIELMKKLCEVV